MASGPEATFTSSSILPPRPMMQINVGSARRPNRSSTSECLAAGWNQSAQPRPAKLVVQTHVPAEPRTPIGVSGRSAAARRGLRDGACRAGSTRRGNGRRRRRRRATARNTASSSPRSSQRRNQPYTVRHGGKPAGSARQLPPTRRCHASAATTRRSGVRRSDRGGGRRVPATARSRRPRTPTPSPSGTPHAVPDAPRSTSLPHPAPPGGSR
jgi:hypothetical protein